MSTRPIASVARKFSRALLLFLLLASKVAAIEWKTPPDKITLLAVNTHPDDEGIFFGGALPYYAGVLQVPTMLLSMTSGDWNTNNLVIRENELRNAAWTYGLRYEPIFGRFRDVPSHNMAGNPYTNKMDATWDYWADGVLQGDGKDVAAGKAKAINFVAEIIRRYRPEVIITHDFNGEYGHDNHKATALVVSEAFFVAADPNASATNLVGLAPWQARKLYVHLYKTNALFHPFWETPFDELGGKTAREVANDGLDFHVSQRSPDVSTFYLTGENYDTYDSERWGLFASTVGLDTAATNGTALGWFFENLDFSSMTNHAPEFFPKIISAKSAAPGESYSGFSVARFATDLDKINGDTLTFSKSSGPAWLNVAANGAVSGTPSSGDVGLNSFAIRATDSTGHFDEAILKIPVAGRLVAAWNCNETSGNTVFDSSGLEHHATLANGASRAPSRDGSALNFTTATAEAESENVNVGNELTVAAWIRPSNLTGEHAILGESGGYTLKTSGTSLRLTIPGVKDHTYTAGFVADQWCHVAVSFQAGATNACKFYINGQLRFSTNASTKPLTSNPTWIGRNQWGQNFAGLIDDVRIYRAVLTASEIAALYGNASPIFTSNPIQFPTATEGANYSAQSLSSKAIDLNSGDLLSFRKISGPAWLDIASNGALSGTPSAADVGTNSFQVEVADQHRATAVATMQLVVAHQPTFLLGLSTAGNNLQLTFTGEPSKTYKIFGSSNLVHWTEQNAIATDATGRASWTNSAPSGQGFFYRVQ